MASTTIKGTYSLDPETIRALEDMARRLRISKSEALRRAIRLAAEDSHPGQAALASLDAIQAALAPRRRRLEAWTGALRKDRHAASARRERAWS